MTEGELLQRNPSADIINPIQEIIEMRRNRSDKVLTTFNDDESTNQ